MEESQEKSDQYRTQEDKCNQTEEGEKAGSSHQVSTKEERPRRKKRKFPSFGEVWLRLKILIACLIVIALVFFISQNVKPTRVKFLFWKKEISVSLLVILSAALGAAALGIVMIKPRFFSKK